MRYYYGFIHECGLDTTLEDRTGRRRYLIAGHLVKFKTQAERNDWVNHEHGEYEKRKIRIALTRNEARLEKYSHGDWETFLMLDS